LLSWRGATRSYKNISVLFDVTRGVRCYPFLRYLILSPLSPKHCYFRKNIRKSREHTKKETTLELLFVPDTLSSLLEELSAKIKIYFPNFAKKAAIIFADIFIKKKRQRKLLSLYLIRSPLSWRNCPQKLKLISQILKKKAIIFADIFTKKRQIKLLSPVFRIRIHRIHMFLGHKDPDLDPLVRGMDPGPDPDPSIIKLK
jgi:hypothetical protein